MDILNKKQKIIILVVATFMLLFIGYYIINKANNSEFIELETEEKNEIETTINKEDKIEENNIIIVHITGAVKQQGIIEIEEGARISNVIDKAGGITEQADLSKINLAYIVQDGQKIYVPNVNDNLDFEYITEKAGENVLEDILNKEEKVNINTANQTELETLSGIGPSTALKIVNYREENGNFKKIEDIKNVPGIGEAKFESIKENIYVK